MKASSSPSLTSRCFTLIGITVPCRPELVRVAVELGDELPANDVDELLGVRVVVLADPVAGGDRGDRP